MVHLDILPQEEVRTSPQPVPSDWTAYGNAGGGGGYYGGGGGGGAGAAGSQGPSSNGGAGGNGQPFTEFPAPVLEPGIPSPIYPAWSTHVS